jgi:hypothetical protein
MKRTIITIILSLLALTPATATAGENPLSTILETATFKPYAGFGFDTERNGEAKIEESLINLGINVESGKNTFNAEARINTDSQIRRLTLGIEHMWEITPQTWKSASLHAILGATIENWTSEHPAYERMSLFKPKGGFKIKWDREWGNYYIKALISHPTNTMVKTAFDANAGIGPEIHLGITIGNNTDLYISYDHQRFRSDGIIDTLNTGSLIFGYIGRF